MDENGWRSALGEIARQAMSSPEVERYNVAERKITFDPAYS